MSDTQAPPGLPPELVPQFPFPPVPSTAPVLGHQRHQWPEQGGAGATRWHTGLPQGTQAPGGAAQVSRVWRSGRARGHGGPSPSGHVPRALPPPRPGALPLAPLRHAGGTQPGRGPAAAPGPLSRLPAEAAACPGLQACGQVQGELCPGRPPPGPRRTTASAGEQVFEAPAGRPATLSGGAAALGWGAEGQANSSGTVQRERLQGSDQVLDTPGAVSTYSAKGPSPHPGSWRGGPNKAFTLGGGRGKAAGQNQTKQGSGRAAPSVLRRPAGDAALCCQHEALPGVVPRLAGPGNGPVGCPAGKKPYPLGRFVCKLRHFAEFQVRKQVVVIFPLNSHLDENINLKKVFIRIKA